MNTPIIRPILRLKKLFRTYRKTEIGMRIEHLWDQYCKMEIWLRSSALSFHTLLGAVPILALLLLYLNKAGVTEKWLRLLYTFIISNLNVVASENFNNYFDQITLAIVGQTWGWVGIFILVYASWGLITKFGASLDFILNIKSANQTPMTINFLFLTLRRGLVMLALPAALLFSVAAMTWIEGDSFIKRIFSIETVGPFLALPVAWGVQIFMTSLIYFLIPSKRVPYINALRASFIVVPCLELTKYLIGSYSSHAFSTHKMYGIFAAIPLTIFWIQLFWTILLVGGLLLNPKKKSRLPAKKRHREVGA